MSCYGNAVSWCRSGQRLPVPVQHVALDGTYIKALRGAGQEDVTAVTTVQVTVTTFALAACSHCHASAATPPTPPSRAPSSCGHRSAPRVREHVGLCGGDAAGEALLVGEGVTTECQWVLSL